MSGGPNPGQGINVKRHIFQHIQIDVFDHPSNRLHPMASMIDVGKWDFQFP